MRQVLPDAAALMDELRQMFGAAWADAALREGLRLQREHAQLLAEQGTRTAQAWLQTQGRTPALSLRQGEHVVGLLPRRAARKP